MSQDRDVVVAGAGIGGLTAALRLHAAGRHPTVLEGVRELRPLGVGINLLPHAVRELAELGLGDDLARLGVATGEIVYLDAAGTELFTEPRGHAGEHAYPQYSVHRGELQLLLYDAVRERLGPDAVRTGTKVLGVDDAGGELRAEVPDGVLRPDVLVGADGVHSVVRRHMHPGPDPLLWSGVTMWRGLTDGVAFRDSRSMLLARDGQGVELVAYPIGGGRMNWVVLAEVGAAGPLPGDAGWNTPGAKADVLARLAGWDLGEVDVHDLVTRSATVLEYPMVDREPLPWWGRGRVTLLGDAAHPMYPVGANGASQAILDARVLVDELTGAPDDPATALRRYEEDRRPATAAVVAANREMQETVRSEDPAELARITAAYRRTTGADRPQAAGAGR